MYGFCSSFGPPHNHIHTHTHTPIPTHTYYATITSHRHFKLHAILSVLRTEQQQKLPGTIDVELRLACKPTESHTSTNVSTICFFLSNSFYLSIDIFVVVFVCLLFPFLSHFIVITIGAICYIILLYDLCKRFYFVLAYIFDSFFSTCFCFGEFFSHCIYPLLRRASSFIYYRSPPFPSSDLPSSIPPPSSHPYMCMPVMFPTALQ